ncbi:MAG TPA: serine/threonine protein kinase, partial [Leptolyngbya sp.]|nr:serine/threonine protein kinase [Leptolyngbya sp.]
MLLANRYEIVRLLGEGGFGRTFVVEDTQMPSKRLCVLKQLKPMTTETAVYQVIQDRFQREAAILERLGERHPQIPKLYAYFTDAGQFYLVQEWIEGATLEQSIADGTVFDEGAVQQILLDLLPVLDFIHTQGMIHRDIKPENIILRQSDRRTVLIDFGAVRETMGTVYNSRGNPTSSIVIGTPGYMSAEQAAGRPIPSSDLYSLGLTAIYLLTRRMPQTLETDLQTGEILWQHVAPGLSPKFAAILTQMIRSHPRDRYASAAQVQAALEPSAPLPSTILPSEPSAMGTIAIAPSYPPAGASSPATRVATASEPQRSLWLISGLIGGGLLIAAIAAGFFLNRDRPVAPPIAESPSPSIPPVSSPTPTSSPSTQASPLTIPSEPSRPDRRSPAPSPTASPQGISEPLLLEGIAGGQVQVYSQPSTRSTSPSYGLTGDRVTALRRVVGDDQATWFFVRFPSGAEGWVQAEQTRSVNDPPKSEFPRSAQLIGQTPGSRVNLRSAPSNRASSPSYGLVGDQVTVIQQARGDDSNLWYFV